MFRRNISLALAVLGVFTLALSGCSGGGSTPDTALFATYDQYAGAVSDSTGQMYQTVVDLAQSTDYPGKAEIRLTFYIPGDDSNPKLYKARYTFDIMAKSYEETQVPFVDSKAHVVMGLYPTTGSRYETMPICHITTDIAVANKQYADVAYKSSDCSMVGKGQYHATYSGGKMNTTR